MRIVVTGATGNVGTSVVAALAQAPAVEEIVGLARRRPSWRPPKTTWTDADVVASDLMPIFSGADAVIHLAWAIQPSRDLRTLERINLEGSKRVFDAVAAAAVPKLVYASSVGAYARGPKDREVDESWPIAATPSSSYSRHKVAVERILDAFEREHGEVAVARLRPALIFKGEAGTEIRRLFAGPFLPSFMLRSSLVPALPRIAGLRFQAVHSADVAAAYVRAATGPATGPFNIAAPPPLDTERLAELLGVRTFSVPPGVVRRLADASWRLRLQPTPPGWLDMALDVPLMSSARAREVLGWQPQHSAVAAAEELAEGMRRGRGYPTPPLAEAGAGGRVEELRTGMGGRQWAADPEQQLVKYLTDVHSIEEQALTQMRTAPEIAGEEHLSEIFSQHLRETETQEQRVRARLAAHGSGPSRVKDLAARAGGTGMLIFARSQPDTPGKLAAHAFSYEHMEKAAYELLRRIAEQAGDAETAATASAIAAEEQRMADRIAESFDDAVGASLDDPGPAELEAQLDRYLGDAHAIEEQALQLLEAAPAMAEDDELRRLFEGHLEETRGHQRAIEQRLAERGSEPSSLKDAALRAGGLNIGGFFGAQPDTPTKLSGFAYAFEHLEIAAYELLKRVAERAGDTATVAMADRILVEERAAADGIAASWDQVAAAYSTLP